MTALELRIPPVVITAIVAGLMWVAAALTPSLAFDVPGRLAVAAAFFVAGMAVALAGVITFRSASTTVNPIQPENASFLVTSGVYRITRNPMYLGLLLLLLGWATWLAHPLPFVTAPLFIAYMSQFQIKPEERALRAKFDDAFEAYVQSTRRWL